MKRKSIMKVARGRLEEEQRREDRAFEYQKVLLIMLPVIMLAVLVVGVYFGYLSYVDSHIEIAKEEREKAVVVEEYSESELDFLLTVVNSGSSVESSFVPVLEEYGDIEVSYLMTEDLKTMIADAKEQGVELVPEKGYVSFEEQKEIYNKAVKSYKKKKKCSTVKAEVAVKKTIPDAGESELQTGLVVQFSDGTDKKFEKTEAFRWLAKNCVNYGFILRYPEKENPGGVSYTPDLFRYVGKEFALDMRAYNMNFDEFVLYLGAQ